MKLYPLSYDNRKLTCAKLTVDICGLTLTDDNYIFALYSIGICKLVVGLTDIYIYFDYYNLLVWIPTLPPKQYRSRDNSKPDIEFLQVAYYKTISGGCIVYQASLCHDPFRNGRHPSNIIQSLVDGALREQKLNTIIDIYMKLIEYA